MLKYKKIIIIIFALFLFFPRKPAHAVLNLCDSIEINPSPVNTSMDVFEYTINFDPNINEDWFKDTFYVIIADDGTDDYVTMGTAAALRPQTFSISCWVDIVLIAQFLPNMKFFYSI